MAVTLSASADERTCSSSAEANPGSIKLRRESERWAAKREAELRGGGTVIALAGTAERCLARPLPELRRANTQRTVEQSIRDYVLRVIGSCRLAHRWRERQAR